MQASIQKKVYKVLLLFGMFLFSALLYALPSGYVKTDLEPHGIPITIYAPKDAKISESDLTLEFGLEVVKGNFNLLVDLYEEYADMSGDASQVVEGALAEAKEDDLLTFKELILKEDNGCIYSTVDEYGDIDYHFLYVVFVGDQEINFSEGLSFTPYTEQAIKNMYEAVKQ